MNLVPALAVAALSALVVGCASVGVMDVGSRREAVRAKLGAPTQSTALERGERWSYSGGIEGRETWMFEFDASGQLIKQFQARTPERIAQIAAGIKQADVEALIGSSQWTKRYLFLPDELVYIYRFSDDRVPMCFYVTYDPSATVIKTGMQKEIQGSERWGPPC